MLRLLPRFALMAMLLGPALAVAQPTQPAPKAAPKAVQKPPVVKAKPGAAGQKPAAKPVAKPVAKPGAKAPAVVPPPAETPQEKAPDLAKGASTGLPLPRFATLKFDEVNLRTGPGTRYPIEWVYRRRDLPVQIEREFDLWRLIRDQEGVKGWVLQTALISRRTGVVLAGPGKADPVLRREPEETAPAVARLQPGVIVRIRRCEAASDWCEASIQDYRGWIRRGDVWGMFPGEAVQ